MHTASDSDLEDSSVKLQSQQEKIEALTDQLRSTQDRVKRLQDLLELTKLEIEDGLELVRRSWSWRITYPLRLASVAMARVRAFALATVPAHFRFQQRRRQKTRIQVWRFLKESRLFDESFPLDQKQNVATQQAWPDIHHVDQRAAQDRSPLLQAGRLTWLNLCLQSRKRRGYFLKQLAGEHPLDQPAKIAVYSSSEGNYFFHEIRDLIAAGFRKIGICADCCDENSNPTSDTSHHLFVAPHEFFTLGRGKEWVNSSVVDSSIMLSTEQPQTVWFALSWPLLRRARTVLEMNFQSAAFLRSKGVEAYFFPLGYLEEYSPFRTIVLCRVSFP